MRRRRVSFAAAMAHARLRLSRLERIGHAGRIAGRGSGVVAPFLSQTVWEQRTHGDTEDGTREVGNTPTWSRGPLGGRGRTADVRALWDLGLAELVLGRPTAGWDNTQGFRLYYVHFTSDTVSYCTILLPRT